MTKPLERTNILWRREGSIATDNLRYVAYMYQAGSLHAQRLDMVIESLESIMRGKGRLYEARLFGAVVTVKPALRSAKHTAENHLRWELDKMGWGLAGGRKNEKGT